MLQQTLLDTKPKLAPMSIQVGPVTITQDEHDPQKAWISVGNEMKQLTNEELHKLSGVFSMFMTAMNYQRQGWKRPFVKDE